jgi:hypothetical protein
MVLTRQRRGTKYTLQSPGAVFQCHAARMSAMCSKTAPQWDPSHPVRNTKAKCKNTCTEILRQKRSSFCLCFASKNSCPRQRLNTSNQLGAARTRPTQSDRLAASLLTKISISGSWNRLLTKFIRSLRCTMQLQRGSIRKFYFSATH